MGSTELLVAVVSGRPKQNTPGRKAPGSSPLPWTGLALLAALTVTGCSDTAVCVFGGSCNVNLNPGLGSGNAVFPVSGNWIDPANPTVQRVLPDGAGAHSRSPIVLVFNESMSGNSVINSFALTETSTGATLPLSGNLVGDGRVLVLIPGAAGPGFPSTLAHESKDDEADDDLTGIAAGGTDGGEIPDPLMPGLTYEIRLADGATALDLTGQELTDSDGLLGSFTVADPVSDVPAVLATWPGDGDMNASATTEMVVVFDREVAPTSVTAMSMFIDVDGVPPMIPPVAFDQLMIAQPFGPSLPEPRVWTFRNEDASGEPVPLISAVDFGAGAVGDVTITISPATFPISDADMMNEVAETSATFNLSNVFAPAMATIMSAPTDAIGIENLVDPMGGQGDFMLDLILQDGLTDDVIDIFLFGRLTNSEGLPFNAAFSRTFTLPADTMNVVLTETELDLATSLAPLVPLFEDGDVGMAFRVRRGTISTPVHVLDVDDTVPGVQDALLDTTRPTLLGFGTSGTTIDSFRTNLRNFSLIGRANELLREVDVTASVNSMMFDNAIDAVLGAVQLPTPPMTDPEFLFLASPVVLPATGAIDPTLSQSTFTVSIKDRALNTAEQTFAGTLFQVGSTAPGAALMPGGQVVVEVVDSRTLEPIENALVFSHQDDMGTVTSLSSIVTDDQGVAIINGAVLAGAETIITVDAPLHDLFTFHGVTTDRISIPVEITENFAITQNQISAIAEGTTFGSLTRRAADSRVDPTLDPLVDMPTCLPFGATSEGCTGAPFIRPGLLGAVSALGGFFPNSVMTYSAQSLLQAFTFAVPAAPLGSGGIGASTLNIDRFLAGAAGAPDEELAIDWLPHPGVVTNPAITPGIDLTMLQGLPTVAAQANVPGVPQSMAVGLGVSFDDMMGGYDVRAAYAGIADPVADPGGDLVGSLIDDGIIEPELRLRVELIELPVVIGGLSVSRRAGARPTLSSMAAQIFPLGVPTIQAPPPLTLTGPSGFDIVFDGVVNDQIVLQGKRGIYKVTLVDTNNRKWHLYRGDQNNAAGLSVSVHAPDIELVGGAGLADSDIVVSVSAYAWAGLDLSDFFFTDIEREYDLFSHAQPSTFNNQ